LDGKRDTTLAQRLVDSADAIFSSGWRKCQQLYDGRRMATRLDAEAGNCDDPVRIYSTSNTQRSDRPARSVLPTVRLLEVGAGG
jgi:hypothetical protein